MRFFRSRVTKFVSVFVAITILTEAIFPSAAFALTSGPKSPEFMSFTPVATTNMVDLVTGNFNYNIPVIEIPGTEGGGYALSLAYNSGVNSEQEASWVGFGWSLNPGSIDRNTRGIPDDFNGGEISYYNKTRPNWSIASSINLTNMEVFSYDLPISIGKTYQYNNHYGVKNSLNLGFSKMGLGLNMNIGTKGVTYTPRVDPSQMLASYYAMVANSMAKQCVSEVAANGETKRSSDLADLANKKYDDVGLFGGVSFDLFTYSDLSRPTTYKAYKGFDLSFSASFQINPTAVPVGIGIGLTGNLNAQFYDYKSGVKAYGYLNKPTSFPNEDVVYDYYIEKGGEHNKRDMFIGMPFSNADIFSVSGEGVTGGFRAYQDGIANFRPSVVGKDNSIMGKLAGGLEFMFGLNEGIGFNLEFGATRSSIGPWSSHKPTDNKYHFRFNNDLGGAVEYEGNSRDKLVAAKMKSKVGISGVLVDLDESEVFNTKMKSDRIGSSSYVDYKTISDKDKSISSFSICTNNGDNYTYGESLRTRNETSMSFDVDKSNSSHKVVNNYIALRNTPFCCDGDAYKVGGLKEYENKTVMGEVRSAPVATTYLLSQITKPNYVDVGADGLDDKDFGGWTKFEYREAYGDKSSQWYRYRSPYYGLLYNRNSISDTKDDIGAVSTGEKEVKYLKVIETKTHIAFFVTNMYKHDVAKYGKYLVGDGSQVKRIDGHGAPKIGASGGDPSSDPQGSNLGAGVEKLERIVLFSKARPDKPVKTVVFEYNYSLVPGLPNNSNTVYDVRQGRGTVNDKTGRLTLARVWFEYDGVSSARISPYEFFYTYEKSDNIAEEHRAFFSEYDKYSDAVGGAQNPPYAPELLDPWGNMMPFGKERKAYDIPWIYQGDNISIGSELAGSWRSKVWDSTPFDPAAWQLKRIKLPSGGEIHIQYEQKDYAYVQDRPVMAMASLLTADNSYTKPSIVINVDDLGCDPSNYTDVEKLKNDIKAYFSFVKEKNKQELKYVNKVYFKFLYSLIGGGPSLENPSSEYLTGYSALKDISVVPDPTQSKRFAIQLTLSSNNASGGEVTVVPRGGAAEFYLNQRQGTLAGESGIGFTDKGGHFDDAMIDIANGDVLNLKAVSDLAGGMIEAFNPISLTGELCSWNKNKYDIAKELSPALSYVKLPMFRAKRGGGIRVKRLLMYDRGIEQGASQVFGQQYHYVLDDGKTSSGVATNEPVSAREENPLVQYMVREDQSLWSRLTMGEDVTQTEGPLGESLLPSANITYSRVVVENIHTESKGDGFTVYEFYTTKDYPFDRKYLVDNDLFDVAGPSVACSDLSENTEQMTIPEISVFGFSFAYEQLWMTQGFCFILNSMNGLPKRTTAYGGKYTIPSKDNATSRDTEGGYLVSMETKEYYEPGEKVTMLKPTSATKPSEENGYTKYLAVPGKEEEIVSENRKLEESRLSVGIQSDLSVGYCVIPLPFFGLSVSNIGVGYQSIASHATTRVIRYPVILKAETYYSDGIYSRKEYLEFDEATGAPVVTKSYDGYYNKSIPGKGEVFQFSVPAYWKYSEMGPKSRLKGNTNQLDVKTMEMILYSNYPNSSMVTGGKVDNVVSANVTTFSPGTDWISDKWVVSDYGVVNKDFFGQIMRPKATYAYKGGEPEQGSSANKRVYERGFSSIAGFKWHGENVNWLKISEVTKYSHNGDPLEEIDVMGIPSAVKYGKQYGNCLPVMLANNACYEDISFNDFEGRNSMLDTKQAHSGKGVGICDATHPLVGVMPSSGLKKKGLLLKFWAATNAVATLNITTSVGNDQKKYTANRTASSGFWSLYECVIPANDLAKYTESVDLFLSGNSIMVDDVRYQPVDAKATCNAYDCNTFKLTAQFNDDHFGLYYVYNSEGELTHKIVETERGVKTIQEQQHNLPKVKRHVD